MDRKSWLVGLVMGLCLGIGIGGLYVGARNGGAFAALAESTALGTFGDFEWEVLYYQIRGFDMIPFQTNEQFLYQFREYEDFNITLILIEVSQAELRDIVLTRFLSGEGNIPIYTVFESRTIYFYDFNGSTVNERRFYWWSPIS